MAPSGSRPVREGESRTAGMYVLKESDHAIVPMKLLNKEGQPSAEALEEGAAPSRQHRKLSHIPDTERNSKRAKGRVVCGWQFAAHI